MSLVDSLVMRFANLLTYGMEDASDKIVLVLQNAFRLQIRSMKQCLLQLAYSLTNMKLKLKISAKNRAHNS